MGIRVFLWSDGEVFGEEYVIFDVNIYWNSKYFFIGNNIEWDKSLEISEGLRFGIGSYY